jgi:hypothetical protein
MPADPSGRRTLPNWPARRPIRAGSLAVKEAVALAAAAAPCLTGGASLRSGTAARATVGGAARSSAAARLAASTARRRARSGRSRGSPRMPPHFCSDVGRRCGSRWPGDGPVVCSAANVGSRSAHLKADVLELYRF